MKTTTKCDFSEAIRNFYATKFRNHGLAVEALGWNSEEKQDRRFEVLAEVGDLRGKSVLDVGCGFGDLLPALLKRGVVADYTGVDLMEDFVEVARKRYPGGKFFSFDALGEAPAGFAPPFDYVLASGLLGLHVGDDAEFARRMLAKLFEWCKAGVAANFVSTYVDYREDYLAYTNPEEIFAFCKKNLTWKVALRHDYLPFEFTLFLYR